MKWRDHVRITRSVCSSLKLPETLIDELLSEVITPDKEPDYVVYVTRRGRTRRVRVPHHSSLGLKAGWEYLKVARKKLMRGEKYVSELGRALHYIQDFAVNPMKKWWIFQWRSDEVHDEREELLRNIVVPERAIIEGSKCRDVNEFKKMLFSVKPKDSPEEIMQLATFLTSAALTVLHNPERKYDGWSKVLLRHVAFVLAPWILVAFNLALLLLSILLSALAHYLDKTYHEVKLERFWFEP